ncbi:MAG: DEAD/DEAH box helicase family protein, partial [Deltaproteobacteria bacterium]|nr:DEAD/DEAH box helicase family protein [Deltaproteobacteria bacterium]
MENYMDFEELLAKYRFEANHEKEKGYKFEKLMVNFLKSYPLYDQRFERVWLWMDFPYRHEISNTDTGIDLVAKTIEGDYWAIQCKCYQEDAKIYKSPVDSFFTPSGKIFHDEKGRELEFAIRLWISTTDNWSSEAESALRGQKIPCYRLNLSNLKEAQVDWEKLDQGLFGDQARLPKRKSLDHQIAAIEAAIEHYKTNDRGRLIKACGTGKTHTSLKISEKITTTKDLVLFLAPSIALIGQTLREWSADAELPFYAVCVCSDPQISRTKNSNPLDSDMSPVSDLAIPATTDVTKIIEQLQQAKIKSPNLKRIIFSTYQSLDKVAQALKESHTTVSLIVCDEAHRTTGHTFIDQEESNFVKVHDNDFIKADKRLYMTATPKVFGEDMKRKADESSVVLCSMDDELLYGKEFYHLGFGEAVDKGLLSDYKVLVLTVNRAEIPLEIQKQAMEGQKEIDANDVTKLIGCLNALSKNMDYEGNYLRKLDPGNMHRAVAFCQTIAKSKQIVNALNQIKGFYLDNLKGFDLNNKRAPEPPSTDQDDFLPDERTTSTLKTEGLVDLAAVHIDGGMGATTRDSKMTWLKSKPENANECRILCNVRCLSEGVDVPSLDAILFLSAKNSQIDVVQSVGRVMRLAPGKKFGYIIIPIVVPAHIKPEDALNDSERFKVVWSVLNALKSHDDRFVALINKLNFNLIRPDGGGSVLIGGIARNEDDNQKTKYSFTVADLLAEARKHEQSLATNIYARLVQKVGNKKHMEQWANDVAKIAEGFKERITEVVKKEGVHKKEFENFLAGLRQILNPSVDSVEAIEMLAQHLITKPVFEAVFENFSFVKSNPVSQSLEAMIDVLEDQGLEKDRIVLNRFFQIVRDEVSGIDNAAARQKIIVRLYDNFFKVAVPKAVEKLGIVYTPIEIVDFIIQSASEVLKREFGRKISDENVHILDPFTGTGTFITRLIESGLLEDSLERKYLHEIHANEIILLAYYIASINIENAYHEALGEKETYRAFDGICLTDTFQLYETRSVTLLPEDRLKKNSERVEAQKNAPIHVIWGNPPYSVGQRSANDNAQNQSYPNLERRIADTYASRSGATNKNSLYDSYIKAYRWASDRLDQSSGGIIAYVSNAGWLDGNAMDGMRKCLAEEFSKIYVFNLRGNCQISGEPRRKEAGNVFGEGTRTPVTITILVKKPGHKGQAEIYHHDIGDYLDGERKLATITEMHDIYNPKMVWDKIEPNAAGDWLNQRSELFNDFITIGDKSKNYDKTIFKPFYSLGLNTSRDAWCYNYSNTKLQNKIKSSIEYYNDQVDTITKYKLESKDVDIKKCIDFDP